ERLAALVGELRGEGFEADYVVADVVRGGEVADAVARTVSRFGRLDVAFNNAGVGARQVALHEMGEDIYDVIMDTNVRGVWNCMRHQIPAMLGRGGAIVNTSSTAGLVATPVAAPYVASKHAVLGLTKAAAAEYAAQGIRINAITPGTTRTEMIEGWLEREPGAEELLRGAAVLPRMADPVEIAEVAAWLGSDRASFVVGATVPVDGGWTIR
ncbi:SDR family oxidoreductase, partial [Streptomyces sp. NPDC005574]|uniref:SDR family NAD(P)-dependent oxidoreductase n=1 Tax=Streptomyces sp. NPDC005574 TaxID=3156891 RepID=UPI0033A63871